MKLVALVELVARNVLLILLDSLEPKSVDGR